MNLNMYTGRVTIARAGHNLNSLVIVVSNCLEIRSNGKINMYVQYIQSICIYIYIAVPHHTCLQTVLKLHHDIAPAAVTNSILGS